MYVKIKLKSLELEKADLSATQDYISLFRKKEASTFINTKLLEMKNNKK